jgi:hypothetical protein
MRTCDDEITVFERTHLSVVQVTRNGVRTYFLRVRQGASRSIVRAVSQTLAINACRCGERVTDDPNVTEIEFVEQPPDKGDHRDNPARERRHLTNPQVAWAS